VKLEYEYQRKKLDQLEREAIEERAYKYMKHEKYSKVGRSYYLLLELVEKTWWKNMMWRCMIFGLSESC
jgi:hypothetical protein